MNLEQQKKQAREFLRALRRGDAEEMARLRRYHARWAAADDSDVRVHVSLHDAQFALARELGFASWPKLKAHADPSAQLGQTRFYETDLAWIIDRVHGL